MKSKLNREWYVASTGNHQGLVTDEASGENIAVTYDQADAPLMAAAPELLAACELALALIKNTWLHEHGHEDVGTTWGALERSISKATEQPKHKNEDN